LLQRRVDLRRRRYLLALPSLPSSLLLGTRIQDYERPAARRVMLMQGANVTEADTFRHQVSCLVLDGYLRVIRNGDFSCSRAFDSGLLHMVRSESVAPTQSGPQNWHHRCSTQRVG